MATSEQNTLAQTWDLEVIFPGGSTSPQFESFLSRLQADIDKLDADVEGIHAGTSVSQWAVFWRSAQQVSAGQRQAGAFVSCLTAQNVHDVSARQLDYRVRVLGANLRAAMTKADASLRQVPDAALADWWQDDTLAAIRFNLEERRRHAGMRLPAEQEVLISALAVDGYDAWQGLYYDVVGRMAIPFDQDGQRTTLSMGQANNKMQTADRAVRADVFAKSEAVWQENADLLAVSLNHLSGFRLQTYRSRGWHDVLSEPLDVNRMTRQTLDTMWGVIEENKSVFVQFLDRKARLLGLAQLAWFDVGAPLPGSTRRYTYGEARDFIVEQFSSFSADMAAFADRCFRDRWIEAEDRGGKRPGGFCTNFPVSEQSRIFVTFSGTPANVSTIAHELGHAYHGKVLRELPRFSQNYAMNVAETASTFAETLIMDASVKRAGSKAEKISLLEDKVQQSVSMFMNIHARFLFETRFYELRRKGLVSAQALSELMEQAQRDAFHNALSTYHPPFWASKLHFYTTGTPFYNFPYTFGYLFSTGIYQRAAQAGAAFADQYVALLQDTGRMTVEDLAATHLGVNLRQPTFWESAVQQTVADAQEFLSLTE